MVVKIVGSPCPQSPSSPSPSSTLPPAVARSRPWTACSLRHRGRRVFRPARAQWRGQDHADQHTGRPRPSHFRAGSWCTGCDVQADYAAARRHLGVVPQELVFDPFFNVREALAHPVGLLRRQEQRGLDRRTARKPGPGRQGECQHAPALRRHEAARAGGAGAGAQAAGHRAGRTHGGRRCGAAPDAVAIHRAPEQAGPHRAADDPLPGGGRGPVRSHRHAQDGQGGGAGAHQRTAQGGLQQCAAVQDRQRAAARIRRQGPRHGTHRAAAGPRRPRDRALPGRHPAGGLAGGRRGDPQGGPGGCLPGRHVQACRWRW